LRYYNTFRPESNQIYSKVWYLFRIRIGPQSGISVCEIKWKNKIKWKSDLPNLPYFFGGCNRKQTYIFFWALLRKYLFSSFKIDLFFLWHFHQNFFIGISHYNVLDHRTRSTVCFQIQLKWNYKYKHSIISIIYAEYFLVGTFCRTDKSTQCRIFICYICWY
jgi:hypothetical protein